MPAFEFTNIPISLWVASEVISAVMRVLKPLSQQTSGHFPLLLCVFLTFSSSHSNRTLGRLRDIKPKHKKTGAHHPNPVSRRKKKQEEERSIYPPVDWALHPVDEDGEESPQMQRREKVTSDEFDLGDGCLVLR